MAQTRVTPTTPDLLLCRAEIEQFMVCPLCGALNVCENDECFVCRWSGEFDLSPTLVHLRIREIIEACPELQDLLLEREIMIRRESPLGAVARFKQLVARLFRRRLDFRA
jgi:hypothetical protein